MVTAWLPALALLALATGYWATTLHSGSGAPAAPPPASADRARIAEDYGRLPMRFEANRGQADREVEFISRGAGYSLFLTPTEAVLSLTRGRPALSSSSASGSGSGRSDVVRMRLLGANPRPAVDGVDRLPGTTSYLTGDDSRRWATGVPSFARVRYREAYPGIDLVYYGRQQRLEYDFVVAPNADPNAVTLDFSGARQLSVDRAGDLVIETRGGALRQKRPVVYQRGAQGRRPVSGRYVLKGEGRVGFEVGAYDRSRPLVIDPVLSYATYLGGTGSDSPNGIAVDSAGNAYVTGSTSSTDFPTAGPTQATSGGGTDVFVAKLNPSGSALVYSTYLGGSGSDVGRGIAVDATGAYVTGDTASTNFPTASPLQAAKGAGTSTDAFLAKLDPTGAALAYSTYLGGSGADSGRGVAVDGGKPNVTGSTASTDFPTASPLQAAKGAGTSSDAFVARYSTTGAALEYSTYLGGGGADVGRGIAADATGAYVAGDTASTDFPTSSPQQAASGGGTDAFVTKVNAAGSALSYSTYLGGSAADNADGIAVRSGSAYVTGDTDSADFPTVSPFQAAYRGAGDAFVTKYNDTGSTLSYSTYLGGRAFDGANGIAVDSSGRASVVGSTSSSGDFPTRSPLAVGEGNADFFVARLNAAGADLDYSSPLGGSATESGTAIAVDGAGAAYLTGSSSFYANGDFPTTGPTTPYQPNSGGGTDAVVAKVAADDPAAPLITEMLTRSGPASGGTSVEILGRGFAGASSVTFGGTPATSFTVASDTKITAVSPPKPNGVVAVRVTKAAGVSPANPVALFEYAEGSWEKTGALNTPRSSAITTTLLEGGKVLVAGGRGEVAPGSIATLAAAEVYDSKTGAWSPTASTADARFAHSATLLDGPECQSQPRPGYCGKVLVAGGFTGASSGNAQPVLATAELYDPVAGTWSAAGSLNTRRALQAATLLKDGKVLVAGGRSCNAPPPAECNFTFRSASAEIYDPATDTWTPTGSLAIARHTNDAALLPDGKVLVPGGFQETGNNDSAELYDPATGGWSSCPPPNPPGPDCPGPLVQGRARAGATLLPNGKVIVAGGFSNNDSAELYDPATGTWSLTGTLKSFGRFNFYSALMPNGKFLLAGGGNGGSTAEVYDPATEQWSSAGRMSVAHSAGSSLSNSQKAVVLSSDPTTFATDPSVCGGNCGKVLITGDTYSPSSELYTPAAEPGPGPGPGPAPGPSPGPGPAPGPGQIPIVGQVKDTTAPLVNLGGKLAQSVKRGSIYVNVITDEDASLAASATVSRPTLRAKKTAVAAKSKKKRSKNKIFKLATVKTKVKARTKLVLKIKLTKKALKAVKKGLRRGRRSTARMRIFATDAAGNTRLVKRQIRIKD